MKVVTFSLEGSRYKGSVDGGPSFLIGQRVSFEGNRGLMNVSGRPEQRYDRQQHGDLGFWAGFLAAIANAEGGFFHTLNTYDVARFTFGFLQYAAHVPDGDFVQYIHRLLKLPLADDYFPDLTLVNGRVHRQTANSLRQLESASSTEGLMAFLNPSSSQVEDTEVIQAAKFVHWAQNDPAHRALQVQIAVEHFKSSLKGYAKKFKLDGKPDAICLLVTDIKHQGRAGDGAIATALAAANPEAALLTIGATRFPERIESLRNSLKFLREDGSFGPWRYQLSKADFVKT